MCALYLCVSEELISDLFSIASKTQIIQPASPLPQPPLWPSLSVARRPAFSLSLYLSSPRSECVCFCFFLPFSKE